MEASLNQYRAAWREAWNRRDTKAANWKLLDERVQIIDSTTAITISATQIEGDKRADGLVVVCLQLN